MPDKNRFSAFRFRFFLKFKYIFRKYPVNKKVPICAGEKKARFLYYDYAGRNGNNFRKTERKKAPA